MTSSTPALTIRAADAGDESAILELLRTSLGEGPTGSRSSEFLHWKHQANPFGASYALVAEDAGRIVGVRLFLRWELRSGSTTVHAVRAVDTATHPDYRGRGLFRTLTLQALQTWRDEIDLVFNTPNSKSGPGYLRMGWQQVGTMPIAVRIVNPLRFARHALGAARRRPAATGAGAAMVGVGARCPLPLAETAFVDERPLRDLLDAARHDTALHTARTPAYLAWRYGVASGLDYRCLQVERDGKLVGLGFARPRLRGGLVELMLCEVIVRPGDHRAARAVLRMAAKAGSHHVVAHLGPDLRRAGLASGYVVVPRLGIGLVANPRRPVPVDALAPGSWNLSLGDLEVF